jgi:hypothetical protein
MEEEKTDKFLQKKGRNTVSFSVNRYVSGIPREQQSLPAEVEVLSQQI